MHHYAVASKLPLELAHGLEEWQRLNVAHRAAYLGYHEIIFPCASQQLHAALYLVGDVRDDLHCLAQEVAMAFLVDHALIHAASGDIVGASGLDVGEALIVAKVEVGLMAIHGHIALAVLIGVQCSWVNVDVGVKLLHRHVESSREE